MKNLHILFYLCQQYFILLLCKGTLHLNCSCQHIVPQDYTEIEQIKIYGLLSSSALFDIALDIQMFHETREYSFIKPSNIRQGHNSYHHKGCLFYGQSVSFGEVP